MFATRAMVKAFRAEGVEALKSEVVCVLVDSWLLPLKGGTIQQTDQPQRRQRLPHSDRTVILPFLCVGEGRIMTDVVGGGGRRGAHAGTS